MSFLQLFRSAKETDSDIPVTKEGMNPHFVLNGIEYVAQLRYRPLKYCRVQYAYCEMLHPELAEPVGMDEKRKICLQWIVRMSWMIPPVIVFLIMTIL